MADHPHFIAFRADDELASALDRMARESGQSLSAVIRSVVREQMRMEADSFVSPVCEKLAHAAFFTGDNSAFRAARLGIPLRIGEADPDPLDLLKRAADGDTEAQRDFADLATLWALSGEPTLDPFMALSEGLILARMADRHNDISDAMRVVVMLAMASTLGVGTAARDMAAEAIARLELIADGDSVLAEESADLLASCAEHESSETMEIAQNYRDRLSAKEIA